MRKIILKFFLNLAALYTVAYLELVKIENLKSAILAILILGLFNTFLRPILKILTLPLNILSFGLFSFIINAFLLLLTAYFVEGFEISGIRDALIASLLLSFISSILGKFLK